MSSLQWYVVLVLLVGARAARRAGRVAAQRAPGAWPAAAASTARGHYPAMVVLHTGLLVGALAEVALADRPFLPVARLADARRGARRPGRCAGGASPRSGPRWNTRVIVVPGLPLVAPGPTAGCATRTTSPWSPRGSRCRWCTRPGSPRWSSRCSTRRCCASGSAPRTTRSRALDARMIDLLVVGGGPAGLATALYAARAGLEARGGRARPGPVDKACGEGLMPGAVRGAGGAGVGPLTGSPLRGIRYLDGEPRCAEARFTHGPGLGVRRTVLHGALEKAARDAGVVLVDGTASAEVQPGRGPGSGPAASGPATWWPPTACTRGIRSRGGSVTRRRVRPARYGLRRHFAVPPWTRPGRGALGARARGLRHPGRRRTWSASPCSPRERGLVRRAPARVPGARGPAAPARRRRAVRGAGPLRQRTRGAGGRAGAAGRRRRRLRRRAHRRGHRGVGGGARALVECLRADRPQDYERAWRQASRSYRVLTGSLLQARGHRSSGRPWCRRPRGGRGRSAGGGPARRLSRARRQPPYRAAAG